MPQLDNWQHELFCREFLKDRNQGKAAFRAGYVADSGDTDCACSRGSKLMSRKVIKDRIAELMAGHLRRLDVTAEKLIREAARIAFFDPASLFNEDGSAKPIGEIDDDTRAAIAGLDVTEMFGGLGDERGPIGQIKKFKIADKLGALQLLMRQQGMLNDKMTHSYDLSNLTEEELDTLERIQSRIAKP